MRTLTTTLKNAQQAETIDALSRIELTYGMSSYTYTRTRILDIEETEDGNLQSLEIKLDNSDDVLTELDFRGYKCVLSMGAVTGSGDEYSFFPPMTVIAQRFDSTPGVVSCILSVVGICNLMADDKASAAYLPDEDDTKTVKTLINEIAGATLACFSHCTAYEVVYDSEDSLIAIYQPKDSFRIYLGGNRLSALNRLLDLTGCVMLAKTDGKLHIFVPKVVSGESSLQDAGNTGADNSSALYGIVLRAETFTPLVVYTIDKIRLRMWRTEGAAPGTLTFQIQGTHGTDTHPDGVVHASGTYNGNLLQEGSANWGAWVEVSISPFQVTAGVKYAIVAKAPSCVLPDAVYWACGKAYYPRGGEYRSQDNGLTWQQMSTDLGDDHMFEVWGVADYDYDYEYNLQAGHSFFAKAYRNRLVIPNYIGVQSRENDDPQYSSFALDMVSYGKLPKREYHQLRLTSNEQATAIATAILSKAQMWCEAGSADVPMNVGAEVYDLVKVTDQRAGDIRIGNIGHITRHYTANKNTWHMTFSFGSWQNVRKALDVLNVTSDDIENYFSRLQVGDLYVENIVAENCDFVWLDPDNTIDLSKIGDNLDNLPDGEVYARVKTLHLDAGQIKLDEHILYSPGYDPSLKWEGDDLDDLPDGVTYQRVKSAALTAEGLVILDQVVAGTYGLVKSTDISAGHILLSKAVKDGDWYNESGVEISATTGIQIYGGAGVMGLVTRATYDGAIQCYVGTDGAIYAGAGAVKLDASGILAIGSVIKVRDGYYALYNGAFGVGYLGNDLTRIVLESYARLDIYSGESFYLQASSGKIEFMTVSGDIEIKPYNGAFKLIGGGLRQQSAYYNVLYDIRPYNSTSWLGNEASKWQYVYRVNENGCDLPTSNSAIAVVKKVKAPKIADGDYGHRHYFHDDDFPDEMKVELFNKDNEGNLVATGKKEIEFTRLAGVTFQAVREILERLEELEAKVGV